MCGMSFSGIPAKAKSNGRCGGFYIPFAPPATLLHSSHSTSFHSIAYNRTEYICNFDGIANILRSAATGNVLPTRGSPFPPSAVAKGITH